MVGLDVRWPEVSLDVTPRDVMTYPEQEVVARVRFQGTHCQPAFGTLVPETWLSLVYCGHSPLSCTNSTLKQVTHFDICIVITVSYHVVVSRSAERQH